jgi:hypothetical protein
VPHGVFTCFCRFVFTIGGAQQPAALTQQKVPVVTVAVFALQTDQISDGKFSHYDFSDFPKMLLKHFPLRYAHKL